MLTLDEHRELCEAIDNMDSVFTDDVIDSAEYYDIDEDPVNLLVTVTLYDADGAALASAKCEDYDVAISYLEHMVDLEPIDEDDIEDDAAAGASRFGHNS